MSMVPNTGSAASTYTDDSVSAETRYTYRIKAINGYGTSDRSRWYHINVPAAPGQEAQQATEPPAPPTGLSAEVVAHDSVTLTWDDPNDASVSGYVVLRLDFVQSNLATLAADTGTTATSYTDDTVEPDTLYFYYAQAINAHGESELSHYAVAHTPADPNPAPVEPPARPTGLASAAASDLVLFSPGPIPQDNSVTGYRILRADVVDGVQGAFAVLIEDTGTAETELRRRHGGERTGVRVPGAGHRPRRGERAVPGCPGPHHYSRGAAEPAARPAQPGHPPAPPERLRGWHRPF